MKERGRRAIARTFQVAFYGAPGAGKTTTLRALHAQTSPTSPFVELPALVGEGHIVFFDATPAVDRGLSATLRMRAVTAPALESQTFLSLFGCDALVVVGSAERSREQANLAFWAAARAHFATYGVDEKTPPIVVQSTKLDLQDAAGDRGMAQDAPRVETNPSTGAGIAELGRVITRVVCDAFHEGRAAGRPTKAPSPAYVERAEAVAAAADIATAIRGDAPWALELAAKPMALYPELGFGTLSSLRSLEAALFTSWNEGAGADVDAFWSEIARRGLPFQRRDVAREILARGRITTRADYDTVIDLLSDVDRRFSNADRDALGSMLAAYESAAVRSRRR